MISLRFCSFLTFSGFVVIAFLEKSLPITTTHITDLHARCLRPSVLVFWTTSSRYLNMTSLSVFTFLQQIPATISYNIACHIFFLSPIPDSYLWHLSLFRSAHSSIPVNSTFVEGFDWLSWGNFANKRDFSRWEDRLPIGVCAFLFVPFRFDYDFFIKLDSDTVVLKPFVDQMIEYARDHSQCFFAAWDTGILPDGGMFRHIHNITIPREQYVNLGVVLWKKSDMLLPFLAKCIRTLLAEPQKWQLAEQDVVNLLWDSRILAQFSSEFNWIAMAPRVLSGIRILHFAGAGKSNSDYVNMCKKYERLTRENSQWDFVTMARELGAYNETRDTVNAATLMPMSSEEVSALVKSFRENRLGPVPLRR
jgi:hypothetical protein